MPAYVAFLRSINVGKHNRIRMEELRSLLGSLELEEPRTYLQSGNVTFHSNRDEETIAIAIEQALAERCFRGASAMVRPVDELRQFVSADHFAAYDPSAYYHLVALLRSPVPPLDPEPFLIKKTTVIGGDARTFLAVSPREDGMQAQPSTMIESRWKTPVTFRFWNVVQDFTAFCSNG